MIRRKFKVMSAILLATSLFNLVPNNSKVVSASSVSSLTQGVSENSVYGNYASMFLELTDYINETLSYDTSKAEDLLKDKAFAKIVMQREFINKYGASVIQSFVTTPEKKAFIDWVLSNYEALEENLMGGNPYEYNYSGSLNQWYEIWSKDSESHYGVYLRLAVAYALRVPGDIKYLRFQLNKGTTERLIEQTIYGQYKYFKDNDKAGIYHVSLSTRSVWDLRYIIGSGITNEDMDWIRNVQKSSFDFVNNSINVHYPIYTFNPVFADENGIPYDLEKDGPDLFYGRIQKYPILFAAGGVCGFASRHGQFVGAAYAVPSVLIGQPGHAAHLVYNENTEEKWRIGYDVGGWGVAENGFPEFFPFGDYSNVYNRPALLFAYEMARENMDEFKLSTKAMWAARAVGDYRKAQAIRQFSIDTNKWNIDVWYDYVNAMKAQTGDTSKLSLNDMIEITTTSEHANGKASYLFDGNVNTMWHTNYGSVRDYLPQEVTTKFKQVEEINKIVYVPRTGAESWNGVVTQYELYTSLDGVNWDLLSSGEWELDKSDKVIEFESRSARYVKFVAIKGGGNFGGGAELEIYKTTAGYKVTEDDWKDIGNAILDKLERQITPAHNLFNLVKPYVLNDDPVNNQHFIIKYENMLNKAYSYNYKQKQIAQYLQGKAVSDGMILADFNFDGVNANKLMGAKPYNQYSLDGGITWKDVLIENQQLTSEEIATITSEHGIRVRVNNTDTYSLININKGPTLPSIYINDDINKVYNMNNKLFYSIDDGNTWTKYVDENSLPDLSGDVSFWVSIIPQGKTLGSEIIKFNFSENTDSSLLLPNDIESVEGNYEDQAEGGRYIKYAYDGDVRTFWHTKWTTPKAVLPQSIVFELKEMTNIYKIGYLPRQDGGKNGNIEKYNVYVSEDGVNYIQVASGEWDSSTNDWKYGHINSANVKFVKFEVTKGYGGYASAAEFKLYKLDEVEIPEVKYSFDGSNANRIIGSNELMEYSFDNENWKDITETNYLLSSDEITKLNHDSVIYVRYKGADKSTEIHFYACSTTPAVTFDDDANTITGLDSTMEYTVDNGDTWTIYNGTFNVDLRGNVDITVRTRAMGTTFAGCEVSFSYTASYYEVQDSKVAFNFKNKYYSSSALSVSGGGSAENESIIYWGYAAQHHFQWYIVPNEDNTVRLVTYFNGKVVASINNTEGANTVQQTWNESDLQRWYLVDLGNGEYNIINKETGFYLTTLTSNRIVANKFNGTTNQVWKLNESFGDNIPSIDFNFDGENANRLFGATGLTSYGLAVEYSIDGGQTWTVINSANKLLTAAELSALDHNKDIYLRYKGHKNILHIDILEGGKAPSVTADDYNNVVVGIDNTMEYSVDGKATWIKYSEENKPNLLGYKTVYVRTFATGKVLNSEAVQLTYNAEFTTDFNNGAYYFVLSKGTTLGFNGANGWNYDGNDIIIYGSGGSMNGWWHLIPTSNGTVKIASAMIGNRLVTPKEFSEEESSIVMYGDQNIDLQEWLLISIGQQDYQIINKVTGLALTREGSYVYSRPLTNASNQAWTIRFTQEENLPEGLSFEFEGDNANKIMGTTNQMAYSIDGGKTWINITSSNIKLTDAQVEMLTKANGILVRYKGNPAIARIELDLIDDEQSTPENLPDFIPVPDDSANKEFPGDDNEIDPPAINDGTNDDNNEILPELENGEYYHFEFNKNMHYNIMNQYSKKTLQTFSALTTEGAPIWQYTNHAYDHFYWAMDVSDGVDATINSYKSKLSIGITESGEVIQTENGANWIFIKIDENRYYIVDKSNGKALYSSHKANGAISYGELVRADERFVWSLEIPYYFNINNVVFDLEGSNANRLMNTKVGMEFSPDNGATWYPITANNHKVSEEIVNVAKITGFFVIRVIDDNITCNVYIKTTPETPSLDLTINGYNTTMEYSLDGGKTWLNGDLPALDRPMDLRIRIRETDKNKVSKSLRITIEEIE